jgi:hypothetical protein
MKIAAGIDTNAKKPTTSKQETPQERARKDAKKIHFIGRRQLEKLGVLAALRFDISSFRGVEAHPAPQC